jgi:hypothetical protein
LAGPVVSLRRQHGENRARSLGRAVDGVPPPLPLKKLGHGDRESGHDVARIEPLSFTEHDDPIGAATVP